MSYKSILTAVWLGLWGATVGFHEAAIGFVKCSEYFDNSLIPFELNETDRQVILRAAIDFRLRAQGLGVFAGEIVSVRRSNTGGVATFSFRRNAQEEPDLVYASFVFKPTGIQLVMIGGSGVWELQNWVPPAIPNR